MNIVLLSGGSGKRLWPLSNDIRSKQFIRLFKDPNKENSYQSMLQRVYHQVKTMDRNAKITITASKSQVSTIYNQLGDEVDVCVEPCRRNTFPAIVLASAYLYYVKKVSKEEPVVVCPVDPYVESEYFETLKALEKQAEMEEANLILMGIEPTYPSEKYGYIVPVNKDKVSLVSGFKEKPDLKTAERYISMGALWNGGVFAYKLQYVLNKAQDVIGFKSYEELLEKYESLEAISFDYAVVEREEKIQVMRFKGEWKDLGTWNTFTEAMEERVIGKGITDGNCSNVHIVNETGMPILAMGLNDVVISASPQGILVSDKQISSYIKPFVDKMDQQVLFAEKSWGRFCILDTGKESLTIKVILNSGHRMNYHSHKNRNEVWVIISGEGRTIVDGMEQRVRTGDVITMEAGCRHTIIADSKLQLIEVQLGKEINVHDKQKYHLEF